MDAPIPDGLNDIEKCRHISTAWAVCHFTLTVTPTFPLTYPFTVSLRTLWTDPNPSNNIATVILQRAIDSIPALSSTMLLLLLGALALTASIASRTRIR